MSSTRDFGGGADGEKAHIHTSLGLVAYLPDYHAFAKIIHHWLCKLPNTSGIDYARVQRAMTPTIREIQNLLGTPAAKSKNERLFQSFIDFFGFRQICFNLALLIVKGAEVGKVEDYVNASILDLIRETVEQIQRSISNRNMERKIAIIRLRRALSVTKRLAESVEQTEGNMKNDFKNISPEDLLLIVAEKIGIPISERKSVSRQLMESFKKAKLKLQRDSDAWRPKWLERPESLAALTAPLFLKKVWADLFDNEGRIVDEERIRAYDSRLIQVVQQYIAKRQLRGQDLGDAEGILLTNKGWNGPARVSKSKEAHARNIKSSIK